MVTTARRLLTTVIGWIAVYLVTAGAILVVGVLSGHPFGCRGGILRVVMDLPDPYIGIGWVAFASFIAATASVILFWALRTPSGTARSRRLAVAATLVVVSVPVAFLWAILVSPGCM